VLESKLHYFNLLKILFFMNMLLGGMWAAR
jgi:hypothetical protein